MGRSGLFIVIAIVLLGIGIVFWTGSQTAMDGPATMPAVAPAVGDTAPLAAGTLPPPAEDGAAVDGEAPPPDDFFDLIPDNE